MATDTISRNFRIPDENLDTLLAQLEQLAKRASKSHAPSITWEITEVERTEENRPNYAGILTMTPCIYHHLTVSGIAPRINGWQFVAVLEHLSNEETGDYQNIVKQVPTSSVISADLTQYRTVAPVCEHCNLSRNRNDTYVLHNAATNETKQVGKTCLKDFLGHANPLDLATYAEYLSDMLDVASHAQDYDRERTSPRLDIQTYLAWVSATMRTNGWVSRNKARDIFGMAATCDIALTTWEDYEKHTYSDIVPPSDSDKARAQCALQWIRDLPDTAVTNDYLYNLKTVCSQVLIKYNHTGIAASLIAAYERATQQQLERTSSQQASMHQGSVGDKITVEHMLVTDCFESEGNYGVTFIYQMKDSQGNCYTWFASNDVLEKGETYTLKGTVKKHDTYKDIAKTVLTRCKAVLETTQNS